MVARITIILFITTLFAYRGTAQEKKILMPPEFINNVRNFHPVAKQASLIEENAAANLLAARGGFDPVVTANTDKKTLDGVTYYTYARPEIKIPTLLGIELKTGFEKSTGPFINPELTDGVASYIGAEIPILNGLLFDKRRAALQQAKILINQSKEERLVALNNLLVEAYHSYWEWAGAYRSYSLYTDFVAVATRRMRLINLTYTNGDRATADTIEAYTQLQNYQLLQNAALLDLAKKAIDLSQYFWDSNGNPYNLPDHYIPDTSQLNIAEPLPDLERLVERIPLSHPETKVISYKLNALQVEKRSRFQDLLPTFNVRTNLLNKGYYDYKGLNTNYLENNYKFGILLKFPVLLRKERGEYKKVLLKQKEMSLLWNHKAWMLQNKIRQYFYEYTYIESQIQVAKNLYTNLSFLFKTEELRFSQGESSLFMLNSRETKMLEMQEKIIALQVKYKKAIYSIRWASALIE